MKAFAFNLRDGQRRSVLFMERSSTQYIQVGRFSLPWVSTSSSTSDISHSPAEGVRGVKPCAEHLDFEFKQCTQRFQHDHISGAMSQRGRDGQPAASNARSCLPCRKRKSRCRFDWTDPNVCLMCKVHETSCFTAEQDQQISTKNVPTVRPSRARGPRANKAASRAAAAARRTGANASAEPNNPASSSTPVRGINTSNPNLEATPFRSSVEAVDDSNDEAHVIGPVLDAEARSIEHYLANGNAIGMPISLQWWTSLGDPLSGAQPVAFNKHVRRRPIGTFEGQSVAAAKCEIVERFLEPNADEVLNL